MFYGSLFFRFLFFWPVCCLFFDLRDFYYPFRILKLFLDRQKKPRRDENKFENKYKKIGRQTHN